MMHISRNVVIASIALLLVGLRALPQQLPRSEPLPIKEALAALSFSNFPLSLCPGDEQWIAYQLYDVRRSTKRGGKYGDLTVSGVPTLGVGTDIWLTNTNTGESRNLTRGLGSNWGMSWSPNGKYLAFYSDRDGRAAVWLWEKESDRLRKLSRAIPRPFMYGYDVPNWTPDSKRILVKLFPDEATFEHLTGYTQAKPQKVAEVSPEIYYSTADPKRAETPPTLRTDALTVEEIPDFKADLAFIDISDGNVAPIAKGYVPAAYRLSPDGRKVVFLDAKGVSKNGPAFDLLTVSLPSNKTTVLVSNLIQGSLGDRLTWSPDSELICYLATPNWFFIPASGGTPRSVTETPHPPFKAWEQLPLWSSDSRWLYFSTNDSVWKIATASGEAREVGQVKGKRLQFIVTNGKGEPWSTNNSLMLGIRDDSTKQTGFYSMDAGTAEVKQLFEKDSEIRRPVWATGSNVNDTFYYVSQDASHPPDIWALRVAASNTPRRITSINPVLEKYLMGESQLVDWISSDGTPIHGALLLPAGYRKGQRYPLVVNVYGGSMLSERKNLFGFAPINILNQQIWTTRGYAVLLPDSPLRIGTPMLDLAKTVLPGVDKVIEMGIADPERLGVWGGSYGGYSTLALLVQTGRFKAAAIDSGFANLLSLYGWMPDRSNEPSWQDWSEISQGRMGGSPWQFRERYLENSPVLYLDRVQTPLLIIQGAKDPGAKDFYSNEIFMNLRRLGKEATYLKYREGGHTMSSLSYVEQIDALERMLSWFDSHLKSSQQESR